MNRQDVVNALNLIGEPIVPFQKAMIKKLAASNVFKLNRFSNINSNQTHIAITGAELNVFPFITNIPYMNNLSSTKTYHTIPVKLSKQNLNNLGMKFPVPKGYLNSNTHCYVRIGAQLPQIQLSLLDKDDSLFIDFRKCLYEGDYLIVLENEGEYYFYGAKNNMNLITGTI